MNAVFNVWECAPAKINLNLAVGCVRDDGYHELQSLVVFANIGDRVMVTKRVHDDQDFLSITGPFGQDLSTGADNLIQKAAALYSEDVRQNCLILLEKNLPVSSGIGGGSADAAAVIRLLDREYERPPGPCLSKLGADIPVCLISKTCWVEGIGEKVKPLPGLGVLHGVLVNAGTPLSTQAVFNGFAGTDVGFDGLSGGGLLDMVQNGRNDLQQAACQLLPEIETVLETIEAQTDVLCVRMSGSGATCFGLFASQDLAAEAAKNIKDMHPDWWCISCQMGEKI